MGLGTADEQLSGAGRQVGLVLGDIPR